MAVKTLYVELLAETRGLRTSLEKADSKIKSVTKTVRRLGVALAGIFSARALGRGFKDTIFDAATLIDTARGVGVATAEYERLAFVLERLGASPDALRQAFGDLQLRLGDVGKIYDKYFRKIGLDPNQLRKADPAEQLTRTLKALQSIEDQTQRAAIAGRVLGEESSRQLLRIVNAGTEQFESATDAFDRIGASVNKDQERRILEIKDRFGEIEQAWDRLKVRLSTAIFTDENARRINEQIDKIITGVEKWSKGADVLAASWGALVTVVVGSLTVLNPFLGAIAGISAAVLTLKTYWDDLGRSIEWVNEKFGEFSASLPGRIASALGFGAPPTPAPITIPVGAESRGLGGPTQNVYQNITIRGDRTFEDGLREARRRADAGKRGANR